jgi:hypothetical protein
MPTVKTSSTIKKPRTRKVQANAPLAINSLDRFEEKIGVDTTDQQPAWIESTDAVYRDRGYQKIEDPSSSVVWFVKGLK